MAAEPQTPGSSSGSPKRAPHYHGHRERLRARFRDAGAEALADYEMLELVLFRAIPQRDVKPLAKALLARFGSFAEVISAPPRAAEGSRRAGRGRDHRIQDRAGGGAAARQGRGAASARCSSSWSRGARLLPHRAGLRREGAVPHPVSRQAQPADRRRGAAAGHGRPHAGLSARGGQARARAFRDRDHSGAQPPFGRPDALARRHRDDAGRSSSVAKPLGIACTTTSSSARTGTRA